MERLHCEIPLPRPGDESVLFLLADQNLRPLLLRKNAPR